MDRKDPVGLWIYRTWLGRSPLPGTVALRTIHSISDLSFLQVLNSWWWSSTGSWKDGSYISYVDRTDPVGLGKYRTWLVCSHFPGIVALRIIHGISDLQLCKVSIQGDGLVLDNEPMGSIFLVWIGQTVDLGMHRMWLGRSHLPGTVALRIIHSISDLSFSKVSIQGDGLVLNHRPMGPIFLVWIGQTLWVLECNVRDWDAAIFLVQ